MRATDASGAWVNKTIYLVASANSAPTGIAPASSSYVIGRTFAWAQPLGAVFGDIDANIASVSATLADGSALPGWMSLETVYRADGPYLVLAGQSPDTVANNTIYSVKFTAVDALGLSGSTQMNVLFKVNSGPTATASIPDQRIFNNTLFQSTISLATRLAVGRLAQLCRRPRGRHDHLLRHACFYFRRAACHRTPGH